MNKDFTPIYPDDFITEKLYPVSSKSRFKKKGNYIYCFILKHDVAVSFIRNYKKPMRVKSLNSYIEYSKHKDFPLFLPLTPHLAYKNKGWISWGHFLSTNNIHPPTVYKNMSQVEISKKKELLISILKKKSDSFILIAEYLENKNSEFLYNYYFNKKTRIIKIVQSLINKYNLPRPSSEEINDSFNDAFFNIIDCLDKGKFLPEKLGTRNGELLSWMATFAYTEIRDKVIFLNGKNKVRIGDFTEKYHKQLQHIDEYETEY